MSVYSIAHAGALSSFRLKDIFQRPMIIGASVSGDYLTDSPGKRLALRYTNSKDIQVMAAKGKTGREMLQRVSDANLADRSIIIGVDLFFWDSFAPSPDASVHALKKLISRASALRIPIVLGDIPTLMPTLQPSAETLNRTLRETCRSYDLCRLIPIHDLVVQALADGSIVHGGHKYTIDQLLPDGLHIGTPASEFLADQIQEILQKP